MLNILLRIAPALVLTAPFLAGGAAAGGAAAGANIFANLKVLADTLLTLVNVLVPIAFTLALLFFFWGLAQFVLSAGDAASKEQGKNIMIWGIVALFVMASVWGIVILIRGTLGVGTETTITIPKAG